MSANRRKVLVPENLGTEGMAILSARGDIALVRYTPSIPPDPLHPILADAEAVVLSATRFGAAEIDMAPRLCVVARIGVGYDAVAVDVLTARRIPLMVAGTANSTSVAEQALFFIFWLAKRAPELDGIVRKANWSERFSSLPVELAGKRVLVVGFGRIGTRVAARCRAFEMQVVVFDPYVEAAAVRKAGYEVATDLDAALGSADFVTIHCPKNPATTGLFDATRLGRMKRGAFVVNTARGGIIEETALAEALRSKQLGGAGLDVFEVEPTPASNPLLQFDNVITAPHMAGVTVQSVAAMAEVTARNVLSALDGAPNRANVINTSVLDPE